MWRTDEGRRVVAVLVVFEAGSDVGDVFESGTHEDVAMRGFGLLHWGFYSVDFGHGVELRGA
jgi:hypothetical protein